MCGSVGNYPSRRQFFTFGQCAKLREGQESHEGLRLQEDNAGRPNGPAQHRRQALHTGPMHSTVPRLGGERLIESLMETVAVRHSQPTHQSSSVRQLREIARPPTGFFYRRLGSSGETRVHLCDQQEPSDAASSRDPGSGLNISADHPDLAIGLTRLADARVRANTSSELDCSLS
jgi:hypothetical protein